ncbi:MAG: hypothetical protein HYV17_03260 [Xanthomonadales bacterium]|nr:hypothetical protein [Xanthomonadales bacterium]
MRTMNVDPQILEYVARWREVSPQLEAMRDQELVSTPLPIAMAQLAGMVESAVFLEPLSNTSGMVEMQRIFALLRK